MTDLSPAAWLRRLVVVAVTAASLFAIVRGYDADTPVLAWRMFPEASTWRAEITRVTLTGERIDVREAWPGDYRWGALVTDRQWRDPFARRPASYGVDVTLARFAEALDWVAANTPDDTETWYIEARVTTWRNAEAPVVTILRSRVRT